MTTEIYEIYGTSSSLLFDEENVLEYRPGGFHPVALGDVFKDGRYETHHKLGYGGFSTVWLARDHQQQRWVALKITKADAQGISREADVLRALAEIGQDDPGAQYIIRLLDTFQHHGPNGHHQCLVFELLSPPIQMFIQDYLEVGERLEPDDTLKIVKQLLQAVQFLHAAGYAHGDISPRNLAFTATQVTHLSKEDITDVFGPVDTHPLTREDGQPLDRGVPEYIVRSTQWIGYPDVIDEEDEDIRLLDLGEAFSIGSPPKKLAQPAGLQAPETIFVSTFDHRIDLWRTGLMFYYFIFARLPFSWCGSIDIYVNSLIDFSGTIPSEWQPQREEIQMKEGSSAPVIQYEYRKTLLQRNFEGYPDSAEHDPDSAQIRALEPVIRGLTQHLPPDRISASDALAIVLAIETDG